MNKKRAACILILFLMGAGGLSCGLFLWAYNSPMVDDYFWIHQRDTEIDLAFAFTVALRANHPDAYKLVGPGLKPRLDEWMNTHPAVTCAEKSDHSLLTKLHFAGSGYNVLWSCFVGEYWYEIQVDNILIEDMQVIDWGEVTEEKH